MKIDKQVIPYLRANAKEALGVTDFTGAVIQKLEGGDYNYNYHVQQARCDVVVRLNIEPQSGSDNQIVHEYKTLEFLASHDVAPKPLFVDNARKHFPYGLLIEEYVPGGHVQFSVAAVRRVAEAMATLHTIPIAGAPLERRDNPLRDQFDSVVAYLREYEHRQNPNSDIIRLGQLIISQLKKKLPELEVLYSRRSVVHTDPNPAKTNDTSIEDRIPPRLKLYTLTAVIWGASRIADVSEGKIDPHLGKQNYERYQQLVDPSALENALRM